MSTPKKWPEERDLLAWYIFSGLDGSEDESPNIILQMIIEFQEIGSERAHKYLYKQFGSFGELFAAPDKQEDKSSVDVSAILTENKEAIGEELHRQFNSFAEKKE